jgi:hypothetical protein
MTRGVKLHGQADVPEIVQARGLPGYSQAGSANGKQQRQEDANDSYNDQQFDQSEAWPPAARHWIVSDHHWASPEAVLRFVER